MNIENLIAQLKEQGLSEEQILPSLEEMVKEGSLTPEELEQAKMLLQQAQQPVVDSEEAERKQASEMFGVQL